MLLLGSLGGPGSDRSWARDGASDVIECGSGRGTVRSADEIDLVGGD